MVSSGDFSWQLKDPVVVLDNGPWLARHPRFAEYLGWGSFHVISFDPGMTLAREAPPAERFQSFALSMLGSPGHAEINICMEQEWSASLAPLMNESLPPDCQAACQIIARLPVTSIALDAIEGLPHLDWLILGAGHDHLDILEHGRQALDNTLLLQVELYFQPVHQQQPGFEQIAERARQHGLRFHSFSHVCRLPATPQDSPASDNGGAWLKACALFIPDARRLQQLSSEQLIRLAFLMDAIHDSPLDSHALLQQADPALAERYALARLPRTQRMLPGELTHWSAVEEVQEQPLPELIRERAMACLGHGSVYGALLWSRMWLEKSPDSPQALYCLAEAQSYAGQHASALALLQRLQRQQPDAAHIAASLAWAHWRASQPKGTRKALEALLERPTPDDSSIRYLQARLLASSAKPRERREAVLLCDRALQLNPAATHWLALLACLLGTGEAERARDHVNQALEALADCDLELRGLALLDLADTLERLGEDEQALSILQSLTSEYPVSLSTQQAQVRLTYMLRRSALDARQKHGEWLYSTLNTWKQSGHGRFGLPEQSLPALHLAGYRDTALRLQTYALGSILTENARVLDIRCRNGALLLELATQVAQGVGLTEHPAEQALAKACAERLQLDNLVFLGTTLQEYEPEAPFQLVIASESLFNSGLQWEEFGERLLALCAPAGWVLLESQGNFDLEAPEPNFEEMAVAIASAGFEICREIRLCDDGTSLRSARLLRAPDRSNPSQS